MSEIAVKDAEKILKCSNKNVYHAFHKGFIKGNIYGIKTIMLDKKSVIAYAKTRKCKKV
jgi:hypothetical protein